MENGDRQPGSEATTVLKRWRAPVFWTLSEQLMWASSGFGANILLGRFLDTSSYGLFTFAQAIFLLFASLHTSLLTEPFSVFAPTQTDEHLRARYLLGLIRVHALASGLLGLLLVAVGGALKLFWPGPLGAPFIAMGIAQPFILSYWIVRAACYASGRHHLVAITSFINLVVVLLGILVLRRLDLLSPSTGFLVLAAGAVLPSMIGARQLTASRDASVRLAPDYAWTQRHWSYGRWIVAASLAHNASSFYVPVLSAWLGLSQAGIFRANQLLVAPLLQLFAAAQSLLLPWLSSRNAAMGHRSVQRLTDPLLLIPLLVGAVYSVALLLFGSSLSRFVFGNIEYESAAWTLGYFAVGATIAVGGQCVSLIVRVLGRPQAILISKVVPAVGFIVIGLPLIKMWGLRGALVTFVILAVVETATLTIAALVRTRTQDHK